MRVLQCRGLGCAPGNELAYAPAWESLGVLSSGGRLARRVLAHAKVGVVRLTCLSLLVVALHITLPTLFVRRRMRRSSEHRLHAAGTMSVPACMYTRKRDIPGAPNTIKVYILRLGEDALRDDIAALRCLCYSSRSSSIVLHRPRHWAFPSVAA